MAAVSVLSSLPSVYSMIKRMVEEEKCTLSDVSKALKEAFPSIPRGLSVRSVRRYCTANGIHRTSRLKDSMLDRIVCSSIDKVGPTYGRKMMTGLLSAEGFRVAEKRVGTSLKRICPTYHTLRATNTQRRTNPVPYKARYVGEKLHIDQNEKMVMFGVTHICAVDGHSGMIVGFVTMPKKNNILIYQELYLNILMNYGIWDQLRIDQGREWYLMIFIQQKLAHLRRNVDKQPFIQTSSKKNHIVERMWSEVNSRVNFPIKAVLVEMTEKGQLDIDDELHLFCASWLSVRVAFVGIKYFVESWNHHPIPGRRRGTMGSHIPYQLMKKCKAVKIDGHLIATDDAVQMYRVNGGRLTDPDDISDPISDTEKKDMRFHTFLKKYPSFDVIFHSVVNGRSSIFVDALLYFINLTFRLCNS